MKLTHKQAGFLRDVIDDSTITELRELGLLDGYQDLLAGFNVDKVLAEYDREWVTVRREDLQYILYIIGEPDNEVGIFADMHERRLRDALEAK